MFSFFPSKLNSRRQRLRNCSQPALSSTDSDVRSSTSICSGPDDVPPLPDSQEYRTAYTKFLINHPQYTKTRALDALREQEFVRLNNSKIIYMDATGASLYPESLVRGHLQLLSQTVFGNTHSDSPSSRESEVQLRAARSAVLSYFEAPESEYVCIFTANCTGALKLVGESYPFTSKSRFVLSEDSHNSVNGIRVFAERAGATVHYVPSTRYGGFDEGLMQDALKGSSSGPSLVAITGQSNVTGYRPRLAEVVSGAKKAGYDVLLDAAALASTAPISLGSTSDKGKGLRGRVDAMAISFYKMFGYPTGVGALIARKDFLERLRKPWFAGGTVEVVGFPSGVTETAVQWERFEEGTTNYTSISAIPRGLDMLSPFVKGKDPVLPLRLSALHVWLHRTLQSIVHSSGLPVVHILTMDPDHTNSQSDSMGYILSMTFHNRYGNRIPNNVVSQRADKCGLSLRTGCVCNPGGVIAIMGLRHKLWMLEGGLRYQEIEARMGVDAGVVRLSLGITSSFRDAFETARFVSTFVE